MSTARRLAGQLAARIHILKLHREPFDRCQDWECVQNRERLAQAEDERRESEGAA